VNGTGDEPEQQVFSPIRSWSWTYHWFAYVYEPNIHYGVCLPHWSLNDRSSMVSFHDIICV